MILSYLQGVVFVTIRKKIKKIAISPVHLTILCPLDSEGINSVDFLEKFRLNPGKLSSDIVEG